jgi:hypothetical protein
MSGNSVWHFVDKIYGFIPVKEFATVGYAVRVSFPTKSKLAFREF